MRRCGPRVRAVAALGVVLIFAGCGGTPKTVIETRSPDGDRVSVSTLEPPPSAVRESGAPPLARLSIVRSEEEYDQDLAVNPPDLPPETEEPDATPEATDPAPSPDPAPNDTDAAANPTPTLNEFRESSAIDPTSTPASAVEAPATPTSQPSSSSTPPASVATSDTPADAAEADDAKPAATEPNAATVAVAAGPQPTAEPGGSGGTPARAQGSQATAEGTQAASGHAQGRSAPSATSASSQTSRAAAGQTDSSGAASTQSEADTVSSSPSSAPPEPSPQTTPTPVATSSTPVAASTATPAPTVEPTARVAPTASPVAIPLPSATPTPPPSATPAPTATLPPTPAPEPPKPKAPGGTVLVAKAKPTTGVVETFDANGNPAPVIYRYLDGTEISYGVRNPTFFGGTLYLQVVSGSPDDEFVEVAMPVRPAGTTGWVRSDAFEFFSSDFAIEINITTNTVRVWDGQELVVETAAVTGRSDRPTPVARTYVDEILPGPNAAYGPNMLTLALFSDSLNKFSGALPKIAIHGTNQPELMGSYASSGCIRIPNNVISQLASIVPPGTPVDIVR